MCDSILTVVPANAAALYNMREPVINNIIIICRHFGGCALFKTPFFTDVIIIFY